MSGFQHLEPNGRSTTVKLPPAAAPSATVSGSTSYQPQGVMATFGKQQR